MLSESMGSTQPENIVPCTPVDPSNCWQKQYLPSNSTTALIDHGCGPYLNHLASCTLAQVGLALVPLMKFGPSSFPRLPRAIPPVPNMQSQRKAQWPLFVDPFFCPVKHLVSTAGRASRGRRSSRRWWLTVQPSAAKPSSPKRST